jgi:hypothetical protein
MYPDADAWFETNVVVDRAKTEKAPLLYTAPPLFARLVLNVTSSVINVPALSTHPPLLPSTYPPRSVIAGPLIESDPAAATVKSRLWSLLVAFASRTGVNPNAAVIFIAWPAAILTCSGQIRVFVAIEKATTAPVVGASFTRQ